MKSLFVILAVTAAALFALPATASADNCRKPSRSYHHHHHQSRYDYRPPVYHYGHAPRYAPSCGTSYYRAPVYRYSSPQVYRSYAPTYYRSYRPSVNFGYSSGSNCYRGGSSFYFGFSR